MSIQDENQREIIRLGTVHSAVFKASLYGMPIILGYFVAMVMRHDTDIAVLKERVGLHAKAEARPPQVASKLQLQEAECDAP